MATTPPRPPTSRSWVDTFRGPQLAVAAVFYVIVFFIAIGFSVQTGGQWWLVALAAIGCHIWLSIQTVEAHEWGALIFLGQALRQLEDGPVFAPIPFFSVKKEVRTIFQGLVGTPPTDKEGKALEEQVEDSDTTVMKEREPFRVNFLAIDRLPREADFKGLKPDDYPSDLALPMITDEMVKRYKNDPLHGPLTCDPQMVFWYDIASYLHYLKAVPNIRTLNRNIAGIAKATLQECAGRITVGMLIAHNQLVCRRITYRVEQLIGEPHAQTGLRVPNLYWGINFRGVQIYSPGLPRTVNEALRDNTAAGYKKQATITLSEGEKESLINKGAGNAKAVQLLREAEAFGAAKLAKVAKTPHGLLVLQMETLARAIKEGNVTILPADLSQLASAVTAAKTLFGGVPPSPPKTP